MKAHLVGGGLASMAAAIYLMKDGGLRGEDITIYEASEAFGGSLGLAGSPRQGFIYPGGRVFEKQYRCALELFGLVPSSADPQKSIREDILFFNEHHPWKNKCRLVDRDRKIVDTSHLGLSFRHRLDLARTFLTPEHLLSGKEIQQIVSPSFFETNFWYIWSSIMAFVPEHSAIEFRRYLMRFFHLLPQLSTMDFILRTRHHQQQSIVQPMTAWLDKKGVKQLRGAFVENLGFAKTDAALTATSLRYSRNGRAHAVEIKERDVVLITNGSQLAGMTLGTMEEKPPLADAGGKTAWSLWQKLSAQKPRLGKPAVFSDHPEHSTWISFTGHTKSTYLMKYLEDMTHREAGRGGLVTFRDSNWLMTFTRFHDPNLIGQDRDEHTLWGYGIYPERPGNFVNIPMTECSGREILMELLGHLHITDHRDEIYEDTNVLPCRLPSASAVCLRREISDRPKVVPKTATNIAFIGQFCEQKTDVIFTMEYSVRSARNAVHQLLHTANPPPPVYRGYLHPTVVAKVLLASFR